MLLYFFIFFIASMLLYFLQKEAIVSLLVTPSGMLLQSMLPLKHKDFMPKVEVDMLGIKTGSFILRSYLYSEI